MTISKFIPEELEQLLAEQLITQNEYDYLMKDTVKKTTRIDAWKSFSDHNPPGGLTRIDVLCIDPGGNDHILTYCWYNLLCGVVTDTDILLSVRHPDLTPTHWRLTRKEA